MPTAFSRRRRLLPLLPAQRAALRTRRQRYATLRTTRRFALMPVACHAMTSPILSRDGRESAGNRSGAAFVREMPFKHTAR